MTIARIPTRFYIDHVERDLDAPAVIRATKTHYFIDAFGPAADELLSDAEHYASGAICPRDFPELFGLVSSARATARAIMKARENGPAPTTDKPCAPTTDKPCAPTLYIDGTQPRCVMLWAESGEWVGPGLGDFTSTQGARDWAMGRGYHVAPLMTPEQESTIRAAAMRASLSALRASSVSLDRRAASVGGIRAAMLRARLRIVQDVARLKAGAIVGELAAAFALQVKPAHAPHDAIAAITTLRAQIKAKFAPRARPVGPLS